MLKMMDLGVRMVLPFGCFSAGPPCRDGSPVLYVMLSRVRDSIDMSASRTCSIKRRWIASWPLWTEQLRLAGATTWPDCEPESFCDLPGPMSIST